MDGRLQIRHDEQFLFSEYFVPKDAQGVVILIYHALFKGNDGVIRDVNVLGTDFSTALGNVAKADSVLILQ